MNNNNDRIHYGSLESNERQRMTDALSQISTRAPTIVQYIQQQETIPIVQYTQADKSQEEIERKHKLMADLRRIAVPTQEVEIKSQLRQLGQPVTFFGEKPVERRHRLKKLLEEHLTTYGKLPQFFSSRSSYSHNLEQDYFMYEGSDQLRIARLEIAKHSLHQSALRVEKQRLRRLLVDALQEDQDVIEALQRVNNFNIQMSQFADTSGVSRGCISPNQMYFATAGGSGDCKLWDIETAGLKASLLGHLGKCHSIAFHPKSTIGLSGDSPINMATTSSDLTIKLWTLNLNYGETDQLGVLQKSITLKGHEDRVNQALYHQDGVHLLSASYDKSWRLWDLETQQELLVQTGHSRAIYSGAIHPDGSLFYTGDLGGQGMIWDLRTGRSVLPLVGHMKGIISSDFSSNGYHLATGGDDNNIRIWDIRRRSQVEKIPAHTKLVSCVKFPESGKYLISSSYDGSIKMWNSRDWSLAKIYQENNEKITSLALSSDQSTMITTTIDRKFVIWR